MKFRHHFAVALASATISLTLALPGAQAQERPRPLKDHWHGAFGVWNCGRWLPPITVTDDPAGIHSHSDGLLHIHPFDDRAAGKNATMKRFFEATTMRATPKELLIPNGPLIKAGTTCQGKAAEIRMLVWATSKDQKPNVVRDNFDQLSLRDGQVIAFVVGPADTNPGMPPSIEELIEPADLPLAELSTSELKKLPPLPPKPEFDLTGTPPTKLTTKDTVVGTGTTLTKGSKAYMRYVAYLWRTREVLVQSWSVTEQPYALARFGKDRNLRGLDRGMIGMKVGGVRRIVMPPAEAFGSAGNGPIGPDDTVVFYVELVVVKK